MTFGEKLKELRKEKHISQAALAEMIGTTKITILRYESGNFYPRERETYTKLAKALGCNEYYLKSEDKEALFNRMKAYSDAYTALNEKETEAQAFMPDTADSPAPNNEETMKRLRAYMMQFILSDSKLSDEAKGEMCERLKNWSPKDV